MKLRTRLSIIPFFMLFLSFGQTDTNEIILTRTLASQTGTEMVVFFSNGDYTLTEKVEDKTDEVFSGNLSESELETLKQEIRKVRPIVLNETYYCNKGIDRKNSAMYFFSTHRLKKKVIFNRSCKVPKSLQEFDEYLEAMLVENK